MRRGWRFWKSFVAEEVVERSSSPHNPTLEVWYVYGKKVLNTADVNYSFGNLDKVFRSAFTQLEIKRRAYQDVLLLGLGVGNVPAILTSHAQPYRIVGVEIDAEVVRLGRNHFGLDDYEGVEVVVADAVDYVSTVERRFDLVIVDLFINALVPSRAETEAFLQACAQSLRPEGMLLFNRLMHSPGLREQSEAFTRRMQQTLPGTKFIKANTNRMLYYEKTT